MKNKYTIALLCAFTFALTACGGGSSGDGGAENESSTPSGLTNESGNETPSDDDEKTDILTPEDESQASATDRICASHTPTIKSSVGNSMFVFEADSGQCFGVKQATGSGKRLIPVQLIETTGDGSTGALSAEAQGRMTLNPVYINDSVAGVTHRLIVDITNIGGQTACIRSDFYAKILSSDGDQLGTVRMNVWGDQYQVPTASTSDVFLRCIPSGETRTAVGTRLDTDSEAEPGFIANYDRIEIPIYVDILSTDAERAANLSPIEFSWAASGLEGESSFGPGGYSYSTTTSILNPSMQTVRSLRSYVHIAYVDNDGYLLDVDIGWVGEFLGRDLGDLLTTEELTLAPAGGMMSFLNPESLLLANVDGRPDGYRGPANRVFVHFERCFDNGCSDR